METYDLPDLQGNVLLGYRFPIAAYSLLRFEDEGGGRRWLGDVVGEVTTAEHWGGSAPESTMNVGFAYAGLAALGLPESSLASFPADFREGMGRRAHVLGDVGPSDPRNWSDEMGTGAVHAIVAVHAGARSGLDARNRWLDERLVAAGGVTLLARQPAASLPGGREHFGYLDGFSQPSIEASGRYHPGQGALKGRRGWRSLKAGEFLLGYPDEDGLLPEAPTPPILGRNATYMVYRKLYQDVALFRRCLREHAHAFPGGEEQVAAKILGRWRDGTPVTLSPDRPDPQLAADPSRNNAFRYARDMEGTRCPRGAHIRRANPRDAFGFGGAMVDRHRIIRRGLPYGELLPDRAEDDGADRGLIFTCFNSSISRQFELIQAEWLNEGNVFGLGEDRDFLMGDSRGTGKMTIQGDPPRFIGPQRPFVVVKGGEYLFRPSLTAMRAIAAGSLAEAVAGPG